MARTGESRKKVTEKNVRKTRVEKKVRSKKNGKNR